MAELIKIAPNGQWSLEKSKLIKPKQLQLPKNPNPMYVEKDRPGVAYTENTGNYDPTRDATFVGTTGVKQENAIRGPGIDVSQDAMHHEHQHRLNSLASKQLNVNPAPIGHNDGANAVSHHLWHNSGLTDLEKEASRLVNRFNNGYNTGDADENIACLIGWLNGGTKNREHILKQISVHEDRNIGVDEVDALMRSAYKKIQATANKLQPGQTIKNPLPY